MSSPECPRCGYNPPPIADDRDPVRSPHEELPALQAELKCIEGSITRLIHAKSAVLRKLNNVRPATRNLPSEVLSTIFQIARPPIDLDVHYLDLESRYNSFRAQARFLYVLAAVSYGWRQVALSTPRLWTNVRLQVDVNPRYLSVRRNVLLLNLHTLRSRNIPMSIELAFGDLPSYEGNAFGSEDEDEYVDEDEVLYETLCLREDRVELLEPLRKAVFVDQASTIQDLLLIKPPVEWFQFINASLSQCRSVTVFQPQLPAPDHAKILDLRKLPCLQQVQLIDWSHPDVFIPSTINTLHLRKVSPEDCIDLLLSCRNLVKFEVVEFISQTREDPVIARPIVFPYLEHLSWDNLNGGHWPVFKPRINIFGLFGDIQFPRLHSLVWSAEETIKHPTGRDLRSLFFSRLPSSLSSLTFSRMRDHTIVDLLSCIPQISELHLADCSERMIRAVINTVGRPSSTTKSDDSSTVVLPNLRKMSIIENGQLKMLGLTEIVPMLEALHEKGEREKRFQLEARAIWTGDEEDLRRLKKLSCRMDWS